MVWPARFPILEPGIFSSLLQQRRFFVFSQLVMVPVEQTRTGKNGNCMAAALASILECPMPEFGLNVGYRKWKRNIDRWLAGKGLVLEEVPLSCRPEGYHLIFGISPRGGRHAVVGYRGRMVHDPHPEDGTGRGLASPDSYGILRRKESAMDVDRLLLDRRRFVGKGICPRCGKDAPICEDGTVKRHGKCDGWGTPALVEDSGEAFRRMVRRLSHRKGVTNPKALAAWIGRRALGKKEMERRALAGRRHHGK